jgi:hypothetical protein
MGVGERGRISIQAIVSRERALMHDMRVIFIRILAG